MIYTFSGQGRHAVLEFGGFLGKGRADRYHLKKRNSKKATECGENHALCSTTTMAPVSHPLRSLKRRPHALSCEDWKDAASADDGDGA